MGRKSAAGRAVLKVIWFVSAEAHAMRGNVSAAAGRPAKGRHGAHGLESDGPVEAFSASVALAARLGAWMLTLMQAAAS